MDLSWLLDIIAIGLPYGISEIKANKWKKAVEKGELRSDQVLKAVDDILDETSKHGIKALEKISSRINSIEVPPFVSNRIKNAIGNYKKQLNSKYERVSTAVNNFNVASNSLKNRALNLANQTDEYKSKYGESDKKNITDAARDAVKEFNIIEGVENKL